MINHPNRGVLAMHTYEGYKITVRGNADAPQIAVFDARFPKAPAIYKTTSLDLAMKWVDAYRTGQMWAITARLEG